MALTAIIIGVCCGGLFMLVGPAGVIIVGLVLALAGVSNKEKD